MYVVKSVLHVYTCDIPLVTRKDTPASTVVDENV